MKRSAYTDLFEEMFSANFSRNFDRKLFHPMGAGNNGGIKLILDAHTITNLNVSNYKKGLRCFHIDEPLQCFKCCPGPLD